MKIVIIGAVAGGASAAARARRLDEDAQIILIERGTLLLCRPARIHGDSIIETQRLRRLKPQWRIPYMAATSSFNGNPIMNTMERLNYLGVGLGDWASNHSSMPCGGILTKLETSIKGLAQ